MVTVTQSAVNWRNTIIIINIINIILILIIISKFYEPLRASPTATMRVVFVMEVKDAGVTSCLN